MAMATQAEAVEAAAGSVESVAAHLEESWAVRLAGSRAAGALGVEPGEEAAKVPPQEAEEALVAARAEAARVAVPEVALEAAKEAAEVA